MRDGSGIGGDIGVGKVGKVGLGGERGDVGYLVEGVVCGGEEVGDRLDRGVR